MRFFVFPMHPPNLSSPHSPSSQLTGVVFEYKSRKVEMLAVEGVKKRFEVCFYELSDGRGWVPDFAKISGPGVRF
jgi:hypothetical protein